MIRSFTSSFGDELFELTPLDQSRALRRLRALRSRKVFRVKPVVFSPEKLELLLAVQMKRSNAMQIWEVIRLLSLLRDLREMSYSKEFLAQFGWIILEKQLASYFRNRTAVKREHMQVLADYLDWSLPEAP